MAWPIFRASFIALLLAGCFPATTRAASYDYEWVVESGKVVGCIETANVKLTNDPICGKLSFTPVECIKTTLRKKILNPALCTTKIHTVYQWLDEKAELCGEFAAVEKNGKTNKFLIAPAESTLCGYAWLRPEEEHGQCVFREGGRFAFHPLANLNLEKLVPEILALEKKAPVPAEVYEKYGSKEIAATLVYKANLEQPADAGDQKTYDYLEKAEMQIAFRMPQFEAIRENGFLNQHQTGTTNGRLTPEDRVITEGRLVGRALEPSDKTPIAKEVLPKYSYLAPSGTEAELKEFQHHYTSKYGEVIAVLKPEIKDRATFSFFDSLGSVKDPDALTHRTLKNAKSMKGRFGHYMEAQIWGKLEVTDVGYFLWGCFAGSVEAPPYSPQDLEKLKASGTPVFQCERDGPGASKDTKFVGHFFRKGKRL